jgi:predicted small secreted protein
MASIARVLLKLSALSIFLAPLTACNTWSGFGKDLQHLGKSIEDRAKESPSTDK